MPLTKIGLVFSHRPKEYATWPSKGYDYQGRIEELKKLLKNSCPGIEFVPLIVHTTTEAEKILKESKDLDGFVIYMIGLWTGGRDEGKFPIPFTSGTVKDSVGNTIARAKKPTIFVDDLYAGSGEFLLSLSIARQERLPVVGVASSDFKDVIETVKLFEVINRLKEAKIILVADAKYELWIDTRPLKRTFGTEIIELKSKDLIAAYESVSDKDAIVWAERWSQEALKTVEPSKDEILKSARLYLAIKKLMAEQGADAITIDCLGLFSRGELPAYPCLAFFQLNNEGSTGVCEGDLDSTLTQLMIRYLSGRPGYVSDPVIDLATNQIIYAHCVAPNRVYGPAGPRNPYLIRSHAEDKKGAAVQSLLPLGEVVTTLKLNTVEKAISIHRAKTVANIKEEKACRTKLSAESDGEKILQNWNDKVNFGWHRVTCYGDLRKPIKNLATLLALRVIEEDK